MGLAQDVKVGLREDLEIHGWSWGWGSVSSKNKSGSGFKLSDVASTCCARKSCKEKHNRSAELLKTNNLLRKDRRLFPGSTMLHVPKHWGCQCHYPFG